MAKKYRLNLPGFEGLTFSDSLVKDFTKKAALSAYSKKLHKEAKDVDKRANSILSGYRWGGKNLRGSGDAVERDYIKGVKYNAKKRAKQVINAFKEIKEDLIVGKGGPKKIDNNNVFGGNLNEVPIVAETLKEVTVKPKRKKVVRAKRKVIPKKAQAAETTATTPEIANVQPQIVPVSQPVLVPTRWGSIMEGLTPYAAAVNNVISQTANIPTSLTSEPVVYNPGPAAYQPVYQTTDNVMTPGYFNSVGTTSYFPIDRYPIAGIPDVVRNSNVDYE